MKTRIVIVAVLMLAVANAHAQGTRGEAKADKGSSGKFLGAYHDIGGISVACPGGWERVPSKTGTNAVVLRIKELWKWDGPYWGGSVL